MPKDPQINPEDIFTYLRKYDKMTQDEEDELRAEMIVDDALELERKEERRNVFRGKAQKKRRRK